MDFNDFSSKQLLWNWTEKWGSRHVKNNPLRFVDPLGLWTAQLGVSASGTIFGINYNFGYGVAFDDKGNFTTYANLAGGGGLGGAAIAGTSIQVSNADTVYDLAGPFVTTSVGAGAGVSASIDQFAGTGVNGQPVYGAGLTLGAGLGASASITYGPTYLGQTINPFQSSQSVSVGGHCP